MVYIMAVSVFVMAIAILMLVQSGIMLKKTGDELARKTAAVESLRVVNHDYKNRMHVLMGYIETNRYNEAKRFINNVVTVPTEELLGISERITNPNIASLIIGKIIEARENEIVLNVTPDSVCAELTEGIKEGDYITVIGNLLQNAIEELEVTDADDKNIDLYINTGRRWSVVSVMDNGNGIPSDRKEDIFIAGYTTKTGNNQGLGLNIVQRIAKKHNGSVEVESEVNEGTEITVSMKG